MKSLPQSLQKNFLFSAEMDATPERKSNLALSTQITGFNFMISFEFHGKKKKKSKIQQNAILICITNINFKYINKSYKREIYFYLFTLSSIKIFEK